MQVVVPAVVREETDLIVSQAKRLSEPGGPLGRLPFTETFDHEHRSQQIDGVGLTGVVGRARIARRARETGSSGVSSAAGTRRPGSPTSWEESLELDNIVVCMFMLPAIRRSHVRALEAAESMLNFGFDYRERLGRRAQGRTLLAYLSERYRHSSPPEWRSRIESGQVLVKGVVAPAERELSCGETLVFRRPPWREPEAPTSFAVVYKDDDLLAVAKPAGVPTLPGGGFLENTLLRRVRRFAPGASPLHRLGRGTSGLVLFTRNRSARRILGIALARGEVERGYRAIVSGAFPPGRRFSTFPSVPSPTPCSGRSQA